jgi:putative DNA methylase
MMWDFAENNVFADAAGDFGVSLSNLLRALAKLPARGFGQAVQADAQSQQISQGKVISDLRQIC